MKVLHARCAGLDVHKDLVVACARVQDGARVQREQRRFETTTKGLLGLLGWLVELCGTDVAMEAAGGCGEAGWGGDEGSARVAGMAGGVALYARCHGGDGRVLEAGMARARRTCRAGAGERGAYPKRPGPQERRE